MAGTCDLLGIQEATLSFAMGHRDGCRGVGLASNWAFFAMGSREAD